MKDPKLDVFHVTDDDPTVDDNWGLKNTKAAEAITTFARGSEGCPLVIQLNDGTYLPVKSIEWGYDSSGAYTVIIKADEKIS